jgi:hypothetical protein
MKPPGFEGWDEVILHCEDGTVPVFNLDESQSPDDVHCLFCGRDPGEHSTEVVS